METISRKEVIMPGGAELTVEAKGHVDLSPETRVLSVACGNGELELYLAEEHGCSIVGVDTGEGFIREAKQKTERRGLEEQAVFEMGDGKALRFSSESFDAVFCCGALCAFFDEGLREIHRVFKPSGKAVIIEILWQREGVPQEVVQRWTDGDAHVLTREGNNSAFADHGFEVTFSKAYHEPDWWRRYYADRGNAPWAKEEQGNYLADQEYLGLGLFVMQKV